MMWGKIGTWVLLGTSLVAITACAKISNDLAHFQDMFNPPVNLTEYNYGAADTLVSQAKSTITLNTPISVGALQPVNLKTNEKVPPFGKVTADQIGARLTQLGYNVRDTGMGVAQAIAMSERQHLDMARDQGSTAVITGNYTISTYDLLVNLRLTRVDDGRVLAATDYRLPLGSDTYQLVGRDPFFGLPEKPQNSPDVKVVGTPLPEGTIPVDVIQQALPSK